MTDLIFSLVIKTKALAAQGDTHVLVDGLQRNYSRF